MTSNTEIVDSIRELNLSYLILAQRILREDMAIGMYRLGISRELAAALMNLTPAQMVKLASTDQMLCSFRLTDPMLLSLLTQSAKNEQFTLTHASIVLSAQPVAQLSN